MILKSGARDELVLPVTLLAALLAVTAFYAIGRADNERLKKRRMLVLGLIIISFLTGIIRVSDVNAGLNSGYMPDSSKKETTVRGIVSDIQVSDKRYLISIENPIIKLKMKNRT